MIAIAGRTMRAVTVYALGRNYAEHAREMNAEPEPVVFLKPASSLLPGGGIVPWPAGSRLVHHEVELVLALGGPVGRDLDRAAADAAIAGVAIGVDLTARDLQDEAKQKKQPWARSKGFPGAGPVSAFVPRAAIGRWDDLDLELTVDGAVRQRDTSGSMILDPPAIVAQLSRWFTLEDGDVVFTGTPAGVGPVEPGQLVRASCARLGVAVEFQLEEP